MHLGAEAELKQTLSGDRLGSGRYLWELSGHVSVEDVEFALRPLACK